MPFQNKLPLTTLGCDKCPRKKCVTCKVLVKSKTFTSNKTKRTYKIRHQLDCRSSWIIYLISCKHPNCGKQYVGKTKNALLKRHYGHKNQFKNKISELGKHFHWDHHGEKIVSIKVIDQVKAGNSTALEQCEGFWQHQLMTLVENGGLNSQDDLQDVDYKR